MTVPHTHPKPLEPWALELLQQDPVGDDPRTQQELAQLVALLRALPDPERSPELARRILEYVAEQESRRRVVHALFGAARPLTRPGVDPMAADTSGPTATSRTSRRPRPTRSVSATSTR